MFWRSGLFVAALLFVAGIAEAIAAEPVFRRVPTQFIAALGDPQATSGVGAQNWLLWRKDPGPRGVWLSDFRHLQAAGGVAPARWTFDANDWWLDENGILMEKPRQALIPGRYVVTGDREAVAILTVYPKDETGEMRWELDGAKLYDVTHLPCRSARYRPASPGGTCTPSSAEVSKFPVKPGGIKAYQMRLGEPVSTSSLVDIFEPDSEIQYSRVSAQEKYFQEWLKSLGH